MAQIISGLPVNRAKLVLHGVAAWLGGSPLAYSGERGGAVVHTVAPSAEKTWQGRSLHHTSLGADRIGMHTEMAFHAIRPAYVLLFCVRNCQTATLVAPSATIVSQLSRPTSDLLQKPMFRIQPPPSFTEPYACFWRPLVCPRSLRLVMASHCVTEFANREASQAFHELLRVVQDNSLRVVLRPGDVLVVDNRFVLHGREALHPADLTSRLLERMYVQMPSVPPLWVHNQKKSKT